MKTDVVIVGGGPCGLLTARLLGRLGIDTVLVEKHTHILDHPKAMGVTRRTAEIFLQAGLLEQMLQGQPARRPDAISQWFKDGLNQTILGQVPFTHEDCPYSPCRPFRCPQPHIEKVLRQAVLDTPSVRCLFGAQALGLVQSEHSVQVSISEPDASAQTIEAQFVVAADGDHSPIRRSLGIERLGPGEKGRFLSVYFRANYGALLQGRLGLISNVLGPDFFEVFVAVNGEDLWLMHHYLQDGESPQDYSPEKFEQIIQYTSGMPGVPLEVLSINPWVMAPAIAQRWRDHRVFLVGDASARVSPSGGLGMNNGLQSAHNLAWKLAQVVLGRQTMDWLDCYQAERLPAAKFTFVNSEGNADEISDIIYKAFSGDWESAKDAIAHSRRAGLGFGQDFGIVYESAAVVPDGTSAPIVEDAVNDYVPDARPGHRAPDFMIRGQHQNASIFSLLGYRYTALLAADAPQDLFANLCADAVRLREGVDFDAVSDQWRGTYGITERGGVLVRPDGYVAARIAQP